VLQEAAERGERRGPDNGPRRLGRRYWYTADSNGKDLASSIFRQSRAYSERKGVLQEAAERGERRDRDSSGRKGLD